MTEPDRKFEEEIRRALYAASDLIVPAGDGLNKIRERAARRPPVLGWLLAYTAHLPRQLVHGTRVAASEVAASTHGYSSLGLLLASVRRWPGRAGRVLRTPGVWLRPALATATAVILVLGVMLSIPRVRNSLSAQLASALGSGPGQNPGPGPGGGSAQSANSSQLASPTGTHMSGKDYLATMPPGRTRCRSQVSGGTTATGSSPQSGVGAYVPAPLGPGSGQTAGAGMNSGAANSAGAIGLNVAPPAELGPQPVSNTCSASTSPTKPASSPPVTTPATTPPTTPATTPPTTPATTPPTTPATTPPTTPATTPPTTPATTTPPQTSTSSANGTASAALPTGTTAPDG